MSALGVEQGGARRRVEPMVGSGRFRCRACSFGCELHDASAPLRDGDGRRAPRCRVNSLTTEAFAKERIPGSIFLHSRQVLDDARRFRPEDELRERLAPAFGNGRVVTYCGGGISATLDAFALALIGEADVAVYDGSMAEWISDRSRPLDRG